MRAKNNPKIKAAKKQQQEDRSNIRQHFTSLGKPKRQFKTVMEAFMEIASSHKHSASEYDIYECEYCKSYHIGRTGKNG